MSSNSYILKNAVLLISNSTAFADGSWTLIDATMNVTGSTDEFVPMGGDGWIERIESSKSVSYSWTTHLSSVDGIDLDETVGETHILTFDTADGLSYRSEVIITGASISSDSETVVSVAWAADANGDVTENVS